MRRELLIAAGPGEWRAALLEDGVAVELFVERGDCSPVGSIHLGRVLHLAPALAAALVDIGEERAGFLPFRDMLPAGTRLAEGARALVQIRREAQGGKAARLSMRIALRGRYLELVCGRAGIGGAEQLSSAARTGLSAAVADQKEIGLRLVAPAASTLPAAGLVEDGAALCRDWRGLIDRAARLDPPARLVPAEGFAVALAARLPGPPGAVLAEDPAILRELRAVFPEAAVAHCPAAEWPADLDATVELALATTVTLAGDGIVHIEATRAATLIDVDTGTPERGLPEAAALSANLAAARAIARQLRLRNIGGGIVVDFVGMEGRRMRDRVRDALAAALAADPAQPQILGWTRLGHVELVRPRRGRPLAEALLEPQTGGVAVKTTTTIAHEALRSLAAEARHLPAANWRLLVAPAIAAALATDTAGALHALEERLGRRIAIAIESARSREHFEIVAI